MKKNRQHNPYTLVSIWGKPVKSPPKGLNLALQGITKWFLVACLYVEKHPALRRPLIVLSLFGGYFGLFYLPFKFTIENTGAYFAVVLILWPLVFGTVLAIFWGLMQPSKKHWSRINILKSENGSLYGVLKYKKLHKHLHWPFQYEYFYKKVDIDGMLCSELFILCEDQQNQQFILSTTLKYLPLRCANACEITDIPAEWYQTDFLICKGKYLLRYLSGLTELEAIPQNGTKEPNV